MGTFDTLMKRNKDFAVEQSASGLLMPALPRALPNVKALIIGCADMRVDPAHVLGIKPGEAVVMRNIGGRVTPGTLRMLGLLGRIGQVAGEIPGRRRVLCSWADREVQQISWHFAKNRIFPQDDWRVRCERFP